MNFSNSLNWLWLAPFGGGILLLWLLRPKQQERIVPSLRLWRGLETQITAEAPRRKLQRHWLLFLQLLVAFLLILALARPFFYGHAPAAQRWVLIVDNSASMRAVEKGLSRMDAARDAAQKFIDHDVGPEDSVQILSVSPRGQRLCLPTSERRRLHAALEQIHPTDAPGDLRGTLTLAQSLVPRNGLTHVRIFSDGISAAALSSLLLPTLDLRQVVVGTSEIQNTAITALEAQTGRAGTVTVSVALGQFGRPASAAPTLSVSLDGRLVDARPVTFTRGTDQEEFVLPALPAPAVVTAHLEQAADALASDDSASIVATPPRRQKLLLVTRGDLFLERGLNALPNVDLEECSPAQLPGLQSHWSRYNAVVLDGDFPAEGLPPGRYLTIDRTTAPASLRAAPQPQKEVQVLGQDASHPVMRFVEMRGVHLRSAHRTSVVPWAQTLVNGSDGPLFAAGEQAGLRVVSVGFRLTDSDWPLRVSFPLFLANSVFWLSQEADLGALQPQYTTGSIAQVRLPPGLRSARVVGPDQTVHVVAVPFSGGSAAVSDTEQAGLYWLETSAGVRYALPVNVTNAEISSLVPRQSSGLNQARVERGPPTLRRIRRPWTDGVILLGLLFLGAEWWVYHRRV